MIHRSEQEDSIIRYFFGEASLEERNIIEGRFLADNSFFEQMLSVEDALIDAYVQDELSEQEREKVETFLLRANRRDLEVSFVQALIGDLARVRSPAPSDAAPVLEQSRSKWQVLLAFLGLRISGKRYSFALSLIFAIGLGLLAWNVILQNRLAELEAERIALETRDKELQKQLETQAETNEEIGQELEQEHNKRSQLEQELLALQQSKPLLRPSDTVTVSFKEDSFTRGGGELRVIHLAPNISRLQIRIDVGKEKGYKSYDAEVKTFEGLKAWSRSDLRIGRTNPGKLLIVLPANVLSDNNYTLTLKGHTESGSRVDVGDYSFRIIRRT